MTLAISSNFPHAGHHDRSAFDGRGGYLWSITFLDYVGDVPSLVAYSDLTGYSVSISVVEVRVIRPRGTVTRATPVPDIATFIETFMSRGAKHHLSDLE